MNELPFLEQIYEMKPHLNDGTSPYLCHLNTVLVKLMELQTWLMSIDFSF